MHQPFHINITELDKHAKARDGPHNPRKFITNVMPQVFTLQPQINVARRIIALRSVIEQCSPAATRSAIVKRRDSSLWIARGVDPMLVTALDRSMHEQIGVAPNGRGKMRVGLVVQPEVLIVIRLVDACSVSAATWFESPARRRGLPAVITPFGSRVALGPATR